MLSKIVTDRFHQAIMITKEWDGTFYVSGQDTRGQYSNSMYPLSLNDGGMNSSVRSFKTLNGAKKALGRYLTKLNQ